MCRMRRLYVATTLPWSANGIAGWQRTDFLASARHHGLGDAEEITVCESASDALTAHAYPLNSAPPIIPQFHY